QADAANDKMTGGQDDKMTERRDDKAIDAIPAAVAVGAMEQPSGAAAATAHPVTPSSGHPVMSSPNHHPIRVPEGEQVQDLVRWLVGWSGAGTGGRSMRSRRAA